MNCSDCGTPMWSEDGTLHICIDCGQFTKQEVSDNELEATNQRCIEHSLQQEV